MKRFIITTTVVLMVFATAIADHHKEKPWLDLQNCEICKHMGEHMDMMQQVSWETHRIDNGMLSASVIPEQHRATMDALHKKMVAKAQELESGKTMQLCGFCDSYAALKQAGAKEQEIKTEFGMISMLTADDPELIRKIHSHADRTVKEFAAYKQQVAEEQAAEDD